MAEDSWLTTNTTVREVMTRYPQTEQVFSKHGLTGCGGPRGPLEPLGFFATVHHVDPEVLLAELREAVASGPQAAAAPAPVVEQPDIYRMFVKTALAIVVTVGCTLGAINLAAMALAGVTGSYWEAITQAHGHAQIFGWVGLFILGVAYHVLPRLKATELQARPLAIASFWLFLAGITLRMVAQPLAESPSFAGIVVLSALAELLGAAFFVYVVARTLASNRSTADFWDKYVVASAVWLLVSAVATVALSLATAARGQAIIPAALDVPYLHVSLMGFVAMMIFGISLRTIPVFMGLRAPDPRLANAVFWALNACIVLQAGSGWLDATLASGTGAVAGPVGAALEYGGVLGFVYCLGIFGRRVRNVAEEGAGRGYEKFISAAYFWLLVAASLAATYALYQAVTGVAVPHSLVGAYRHALTVGFISLTIIGMAARIIPVFTGVRLHNDLWLLATFVLVNLGNTVRVVSQPLADLVGGPFFVAMGVSGFIEVTGLALFVVNLWRTIDSPVVEDAEPAALDKRAITANMLVSDVLRAHPAALETLIEAGFTQLRNPIARRTLTRAVTLAEAVRIKGLDVDALVERLNEACGAAPSQTKALDRGAVLAALKGCQDPELGLNIVDLGLIYEVRVGAGAISVDMTLTAPDCPMSRQMVEEVNQTLAALPGVRDVQVNLVFDPPWTPERLSPEARQQLRLRVA